MKIAIVGAVCLAIAGCSQTTSGPATTAAESGKSVSARAKTHKTAARNRDACDEAIQAQANAAMLGSALGMVGGFGGFGGRGGMVASQVASTAGNMVATSQSAKAHAGVMRECS
ncbi:hypothetical protein [Mesorhizobium sp. 1B3]|uniref:hypothetical protein n=1 Tax=Mesorhizobium sp. 1B3 TaxID=3243599 RepID=UPI003D992F27